MTAFDETVQIVPATKSKEDPSESESLTLNQLASTTVSGHPAWHRQDDWQRYGLATVAWGLVVLKSYHQNDFLAGVCERTVPLALLVLTMLTTAGCGGRILRSIRRDADRPLEFWCLSSAIGWAALSLPLCWLAAAGLF